MERYCAGGCGWGLGSDNREESAHLNINFGVACSEHHEIGAL